MGLVDPERSEGQTEPAWNAANHTFPGSKALDYTTPVHKSAKELASSFLFSFAHVVQVGQGLSFFLLPYFPLQVNHFDWDLSPKVPQVPKQKCREVHNSSSETARFGPASSECQPSCLRSPSHDSLGASRDRSPRLPRPNTWARVF